MFQRHRQDLNELCGGLLAYLSIRLAPVRSPGQPLLLSAGNSTIPSISVPATRECLAVPCSVLVFCVLFSCSVFCSLVLCSVLRVLRRADDHVSRSTFLCTGTMRRSVAHWHTYLAQIWHTYLAQSVPHWHTYLAQSVAHLSGTNYGTLICRAGVLAPEHL